LACAGILSGDGGADSLFCIATTGSGQLGDACASPFINPLDQCATGICDDDVAGLCTLPCTDDSECADEPGFICAGSGLNNLPDLNFCSRACVREADCGTDRACRRKADNVANSWETVCDGMLGAEAAGALVSSPNECQSAFAITTTLSDGGTVTYCSEFCTPPADGGVEGNHADCPTEAPNCRALTVGLPNGGGDQIQYLCRIN
jgi:hypothetical protein